MTDLELDVWDAWLRERQEHLEETLSNISPSEEPCRYYLLTGYIQGMLEALTMLTTVEDGKTLQDQNWSNFARICSSLEITMLPVTINRQ